MCLSTYDVSLAGCGRCTLAGRPAGRSAIVVGKFHAAAGVHAGSVVISGGRPILPAKLCMNASARLAFDRRLPSALRPSLWRRRRRRRPRGGRRMLRRFQRVRRSLRTSLCCPEAHDCAVRCHLSSSVQCSISYLFIHIIAVICYGSLGSGI